MRGDSNVVLPLSCAERKRGGRGVSSIVIRFSAPLRLCGIFVIAVLMIAGCVNPFAPGRDNSPSEQTCDPMTIEGVFECFRAAYTFRDTTVYGELLDPNFVFVYRNYDIGIDVTWGRDEEMRTTFGLFQNAQKLDLIWNNITNSTADSNSVTIIRGFNLTLVFNPSDIEVVNGNANITFTRLRTTDPWKIVRWRDESNY
jgi:hypothetical protein